MNTETPGSNVSRDTDPNTGNPAGTTEQAHRTTDRVAGAAHETVDRLAERGARAEERVRAGSREAAERAREAGEHAYERYGHARSEAEAHADELYRQVSTYVREHPFASVGIAAAAGFVIGSILRRG